MFSESYSPQKRTKIVKIEDKITLYYDDSRSQTQLSEMITIINKAIQHGMELTRIQQTECREGFYIFFVKERKETDEEFNERREKEEQEEIENLKRILTMKINDYQKK